MPLFKRNCCCSGTLWWGLIAVLSLLAGCSPTPQLEGTFAEYRTRLGRVLDISIAEAPQPETLRLPSSARISHTTDSAEVSLTEFQALQQCGIGSLIAERNTALGKTQQPSQRLIYETRFVALLDDCIPTLKQQDSALADKLQAIRVAKMAQRMAHWANLIQNSPEITLALTRSNAYLSTITPQRAAEGIRALEFVTLLRSPSQGQVERLESVLQQLEKSRLPAAIWRTQHLFVNELNSLTERLAPLLPQLPCPDGRASRQVTILRNVFYLFFIEQIQEIGSKLNNYHYQLSPVWQQWLEQKALSAEFKRYLRQHSEAGFTAYQQAVRQHVDMWQQIFARCNLSPQSPGG